MALEPVTDGVWRAQMHIRIGPGFRMPAGATLLRRADGSLVVVSPIRFDDETFAQVDALGPVCAVVAPNRFHHLNLPAALARWPQAKVYGALGLPKKRPDVRFDAELEDDSPLLAPDVACVLLRGAPGANEVLLFHRESRTLVSTDTFFNIQPGPWGWLGNAYLKASGALGGPGTNVWWRFLVKDRAAFVASLDRALALGPARLIPSHGEVQYDDPAGTFTRVLARYRR